MTDDELKNCIPETTLSSRQILRQSIRPKFIGRGIEQNFMDFVDMRSKGKRMAAKTYGRPPFMDGLGMDLNRSVMNIWIVSISLIFSIHRAAEYINLVHVKKSELPSATFHASARALAKLAAMMANQGESLDSDGKDLMNKSTWKSMHANEKRAFDAAMYSKFFKIFFS